MAKTTLSRRARLRAQATMERHSQAHQQLLLMPPALHVISPATESQWTLEGLIFQSLRTLHFPEKPKLAALPGALVIERIVPTAEGLTVHVDPRGAALTIAASVFPEMEPDTGCFSSGIPGLRMQDLHDSVEFRRLGYSGSIIFRGVTADDIIRAHYGAFDAPHAGCLAKISPHHLTIQETEEELWRRPGELLLTSSVVRRLGLLRSLRATSIDTWRNQPDRISVEVLLPPLTERRYFDLVAALASPLLSPQWRFLEGTPNGRTRFRLANGTTELDLRLQGTNSW